MNKIKSLSRGVRSVIAFVACVFGVLLLALSATATEPKVWELETRAEIMRGEARNVSVTDTGTLKLAPEFESVFDTAQPYVWSSAADARGNIYLGTGHEGRVYRLAADASGKMRGTILFDSQELDVFAVSVSADGALYAGTSPDGRVYRVSETGKAEVFFDPPEKYIWSLAVLPDGALAVGTGEGGKIYRVSASGAAPAASLLVDTNETHILALAVDRQGRLIAGTDPSGLVLQVGGDGKLFALLDAPLRELRGLVPAADGSMYALAISDVAGGSAVRNPLATAIPGAATITITGGAFPAGTGAASAESASAIGSFMSTGAASQPRSRNDLSSARSAVFKILPEGGADVVWSSQTVTAFALAAEGDGVIIGTNDRGRIYVVDDGARATLLVQSTEGQISALTGGAGGALFAATSNSGKLFRLDRRRSARAGSYESPIEDAKLAADWGRLTWRGAGAIELQTRAGNTETPDATWSEWASVRGEREGGKVVSPRARFIQWRALFGAGDKTDAKGTAETFVEGVRLVYLPRNVRPEISAINVLPPNVGLQSLLPPGVDVGNDAANTNVAFAGGASVSSSPPPPRRSFQRGALALQWQAEDRNGDALEYAIHYRALDEETFRLLKDRVRDSFYTLDAQSLPDGRYIFRIVASDAPANPLDRALTGERTSEPVDLDNTPPLVRKLDGAPTGASDRQSSQARFLVEDATGTIRRADVSVNGQPWEQIFPEDGIADSRSETYVVRLPTGAGTAGGATISLRAYDRNGNVGTARVVAQP